MNGYLINFTVYTLAMIGFIMVALFVYKKSTNYCAGYANKDFLQVENALRLSPGKIIYVIKAGKEKFLIAGDNSSTTMLAKLDETNICEINEEIRQNNSTENFTVLKDFVRKINRG